MLGDLHGRFTDTEGGTGPIINQPLGNLGWLPFIYSATKTRNCNQEIPSNHRTRPNHIPLHKNAELITIPSRAYVVESLPEISDGHHLLGATFEVLDGMIPPG